MKNRKIVYKVSLLILFTISLFAKADISGYLENRFFFIYNMELNLGDMDDKYKLADYNRLRLKFQASPADAVSVNVAVDFFSFYGAINSQFGASSTEAILNDQDVNIKLDRAFADIHFKHFDLTIGKQRVAMGVSYIWSPLDIFNRVNLFEPKEEKPGINAFKLYIPIGKFSGITGVFSPDENFETSRSGIRIQTQAFGTDMALTAIRSGDIGESILGIDFRGENFIGWWVEFAAFFYDKREDYKTAIGFDYTFPIGNGLYWLNEFFYDSSGEADSNKYNYALLSAGDRSTLGRTYFLSMLRYGFNELVSCSLTYIANWDDGSFIINPNFQYEIFQNTSASVGVYLPLGNEEGEFTIAKRTIFFVWIKFFF